MHLYMSLIFNQTPTSFPYPIPKSPAVADVKIGEHPHTATATLPSIPCFWSSAQRCISLWKLASILTLPLLFYLSYHDFDLLHRGVYFYEHWPASLHCYCHPTLHPSLLLFTTFHFFALYLQLKLLVTNIYLYQNIFLEMVASEWSAGVNINNIRKWECVPCENV